MLNSWIVMYRIKTNIGMDFRLEVEKISLCTKITDTEVSFFYKRLNIQKTSLTQMYKAEIWTVAASAMRSAGEN